MLQCLGIEAKSSYYQSNSKLIGSNIYWKKTWQTVTINKDNCTFSAVCSLPKIFFKKIILIWRRWGTPQNFLLALIDELWKTWKIRILKNWKKIAQDIIILHMCTKNHNHMRYSFWDMEWDRIFCQFGPFFIFFSLYIHVLMKTIHVLIKAFLKLVPLFFIRFLLFHQMIAL